jgi:hypothetical protein
MTTNYNDPNTVPDDEDHVFLTICWNGKKWPAQVSDADSAEDLSVDSVPDGPVDGAEDMDQLDSAEAMSGVVVEEVAVSVENKDDAQVW